MTGRSSRTRLRAFQRIHHGVPDAGFIADLEYLQNRDLDLSVRLGALLAFDALMITIGTHPVSASPGAPLSLDAASQPAATIASLAGLLPFLLAAGLALRAVLLGEEFDVDGSEPDDVLRQRLLAAFLHSIETQSRLLRRAVQATLAGGVATVAIWAWILSTKIG